MGSKVPRINWLVEHVAARCEVVGVGRPPAINGKYYASLRNPQIRVDYSGCKTDFFECFEKLRVTIAPAVPGDKVDAGA